MISKDRLIAGLHELTYVEEGMVTVLAGFAKALTGSVENMEEDKRHRIMKLLNMLHRDSARHKDLVDELIRKVEKSTRDEY